MVNNPIGRAALVVFGFWWGLITLAGLWYWSPKEVPVGQMMALVLASIAIPAISAVAGFLITMACLSGRKLVRSTALKTGANKGGAFVLLGNLPALPSIPRAAVSDEDLALIPKWDKFQRAFPQHAAALKAVMEVMAAKRSLPASPVPGGHGGRTLMQHSAGVVHWMTKIAPGWVYEGQKNKKGQVVRAPVNGPHKFTPDDFGLLVLTAFAHDIGKVNCYDLQPDGRVIEVLPEHDTEGAKILRLIPEVMDLPLDDRRSLITAIAYYHHPFMIPEAVWVTDRTRSLMELLIKADHATGRAEGHTLTNYRIDDDDVALTTFAETYKDPDQRIAAAVMAAESNGEGKTIFDVADQVEEAVAQAIASFGGDDRMVKAAAEAHKHLDDELDIHESREIAVFAEALKKERTQINTKNPNLRMGFKMGSNLYIAENRIRHAISNLSNSSLQAAGLFPAQLMDDSPKEGTRLNDFTGRLLDALASKEWLVTTVDISGQKGTVNPKNALWKISTKINSKEASTLVGGAFLIVPADPFGFSATKDWGHPIKIEKPLFGMQSLLGKSRSTAPEPTVPFDQDPAERRAEHKAFADAQREEEALSGSALDALDMLSDGLNPTVSGEQIGKMVLNDIRIALADAELEPAKRKDGRALYLSEGTAGRLIAEKLAGAGIEAVTASIALIQGGSGNVFYAIPEKADDTDE